MVTPDMPGVRLMQDSDALAVGKHVVAPSPVHMLQDEALTYEAVSGGERFDMKLVHDEEVPQELSMTTGSPQQPLHVHAVPDPDE